MAAEQVLAAIADELSALDAQSLLKRERTIVSPQAGRVRVADDAAASSTASVVNLCANNYLGLADDRRLIAAATEAMAQHGLGMASVRFICGTQDLHRQLEQATAAYLGQEDAILFVACFDANGGLFEPLFGAEDAIISDALNHASIIDGIRLSKAQRYRYPNGDLTALEDCLRQARDKGARRVVIATDGVFSMDGVIADLAGIRALADRYGALVMVDDCHATGVIGPQGRGTAAHHGVEADIITGTYGKALGGAAGGFVAAARPIVELLRQRARPYLFSNALPPPLTAAALKALEIAEAAEDRRAHLAALAGRFRAALSDLGFTLLPGSHPIIPVMLGDAALAQRFAAAAFEAGVLVTGFFYPVVPKGQARIRTQMSAALSDDDLDLAIAAFEHAGRAVGAI